MAWNRDYRDEMKKKVEMVPNVREQSKVESGASPLLPRSDNPLFT